MIKKYTKLLLGIIILASTWLIIHFASAYVSIHKNHNIETENLINSQKTIDSLKNKFQHKNVRLFEPEIFKDESLTLIDSLFHTNIISQIEGHAYEYSPDINNYYISEQKSIHDFKLIVISLYWGVCYEEVCLLIIDKNQKLLNKITLTEWYSSCDLITSTTTKFLNDSIFIMEQSITEPGEINLITEHKYKGLINNKALVDTLQTIYKKQYEEE